MKSPIIEVIDILAETTAMNYSQRKDSDLVKDFRRGQTEAFRELVLRYQTPLIRYLNGWVHDKAFAKDLCQDVFIILLEKPPQTPFLNNSIRSWLFRIARNKAIDYRRRQARVEPLINESRDASKWLLESKIVNDVYTEDALNQSLEKLPEELRDIIQLRYFGGFSFREIAKMNRVSVGVINGKVRKGLGMLRAELNLLIKETTQ